MSKLNLRVGEWVEVRSAGEILATLDERQTLDGLPFMPEMLQYCGKRFRVYKSAHKTCDTVETYTVRTMNDAVHLEGLRCDGQAHGGCQAACLLFWKEAWLKPATAAQVSEAHPDEACASNSRVELLYKATRRPASAESDGEERYRCQATDLLCATSEVRRRTRWNPAFYLRDLSSGNVRLLDFIRYGALAMFNAFMLWWRGWRYPQVKGLAGKKTPSAALNLQAGELVKVRSKEEIMATLNADSKNRGLWFDVEMLPFCEAGTYSVLRRIEKIVDEKTGRLITMPTPCIVLDGVSCGGNLSFCRMFCPRSIYPYWREIWLKRVDQSPVGHEMS